MASFSESKNVRKVFLWTAPRCVSTAFERTIMNLKNGKIFHEPYSFAYYFGPQRKSNRYSKDPIQPKATFDEVSKNLMAEYEGKEFIFSKDMAYYLDGNYDILRQKSLGEYKHTFLIRNPTKSVPSLYRASINSKKTGWDYFDPEEVGFRQLLELYEFVVNELDSSPVIVDADDLLENPEEMMKKYCEETGLVYQENMTTWKSEKPVPKEWEIWYGWYDTLKNSTGLLQKKRSQEKPMKLEEKAGFQNEVVDSVNDSLKCYEVLYEKRLRLVPNLI
ncbi:uncharacterized protein LOC114535697 [Dendronephthya gigantea]|uniref:uncharacterized protein LOC114535697 n=1 Tax=Dendronephthya gigantea TaxID=151771 RepID=UPI00106B9B1A|nr:uncharacterized protein LOC114535697 [Dendronephthya gigantea]